MVELWCCDDIYIPVEMVDELRVEYREDEEVCGLIAGINVTAKCIIPIKNIKPLPFYELDPVQLNLALGDIDKRGLELLAVYHTHLSGDLNPSEIDINEAKLNVVYVIIGITESKITLKGWKIKDKKVESINLRYCPYIPEPKVDARHVERTMGVRLEISKEGLEQLVLLLREVFVNRHRRDEGRIENLPLYPNFADLGKGELSKEINPPPHLHKYKWIRKTPDDSNCYECEVEGCNSNLIVDGEIIGKIDEEGGK